MIDTEVVAITVTHYSEGYKQHIEAYSKDPSEPRKWPLWLALVVLASVILAVLRGATEDSRWPIKLRAITFFEIIAVIDTFIFAVFYFVDLMIEAVPGRWAGSFRKPVIIGVASVFNAIFLWLAFSALLDLDHLYQDIDQKAEALNHYLNGSQAYLFYLVISFVIFVALDALFSSELTDYTKKRNYWALCVFVDGPATIAFLILLVYLLFIHSSGRSPHIVDMISGAVVMQMLIADTLYLLVASNVPYWVLANKLYKKAQTKIP